jgi:hypothetical protein
MTEVLWEPCPMQRSHVAHRWPSVSRAHACPGVTYDDPRFAYAEEQARHFVEREARANANGNPNRGML